MQEITPPANPYAILTPLKASIEKEFWADAPTCDLESRSCVKDQTLDVFHTKNTENTKTGQFKSSNTS
jgi:hypothetical protein